MKMVKWRKSFKKDYRKLDKRQKDIWVKTITLFRINAFNSKLRRHNLKGKYESLESIDVTPDLRALFIETKDEYVFYFLKNHNQLYS